VQTYACFTFLALAEPLAARVTSEHGALRDIDAGARCLGGNPWPVRDLRLPARSAAVADRPLAAFMDVVDIVLMEITRANALARCLPRMRHDTVA
jgi:hypothetical protein